MLLPLPALCKHVIDGSWQVRKEQLANSFWTGLLRLCAAGKNTAPFIFCSWQIHPLFCTTYSLDLEVERFLIVGHRLSFLALCLLLLNPGIPWGKDMDIFRAASAWLCCLSSGIVQCGGIGLWLGLHTHPEGHSPKIRRKVEVALIRLCLGLSSISSVYTPSTP